MGGKASKGTRKDRRLRRNRKRGTSRSQNKKLA